MRRFVLVVLAGVLAAGVAGVRVAAAEPDPGRSPNAYYLPSACGGVEMTVVIPSDHARASIVVGEKGDVGHTAAVAGYADPARTVEVFLQVNMPGIYDGHANIDVRQCDVAVGEGTGTLYLRVWIMATTVLHG